MTFRPQFSSLLSASALALILSASGANALELDRFGTALKETLDTQGMVLNWTSIEGDESEVTIEGATITAEGAPAYTIGSITLRDISEEDDHYLIAEGRVGDHSVSENNLSVAISGISVMGLEVPYERATTEAQGTFLYDEVSMESFAVSRDGKQMFQMSGLNFVVEKPENAGDPIPVTGEAESFSADLSGIKDPATKAVLEKMGYLTLDGDIKMAGSWNPSDGRLLLDQNDVRVNSAGTFGMTIDLSGYTPAFIKSMQEMSEQMASATEEEQSAQGLAMLGLMQQLTFNGATIRFDDDSLTGKLLAFYAEQQNTTPEAVANQAKAVVPFGLAQLQAPEFATAVSNAVNAYLDDPQSIEITAKPAVGVPFAQIMATGMSSPQALIQQLGVAVTANQD